MISVDYSVSEDFQAGVNPATFHPAVKAVIASLLGVEVDGDTCRCWFPSALTPGQQADLDTVVAAHNGNTTPKLYRYLTRNDQDITERDYMILRGHRLHSTCASEYRGERRVVQFHATTDFDDLVVQVEVFADAALTVPGWSRNAQGLPIERWKRRRWYAEDGTVAAEKVTHKSYIKASPLETYQEQRAEGVRRRNNVLASLQATVLGLLMATETEGDPVAAEEIGIPYLRSHDVDVNAYRETGDYATFAANVTADSSITWPWLDNDLGMLGYPPGTTIRDVILSFLVGIV